MALRMGKRALVATAALAMLAAACGDDEESADSGGDVAAYCAAVAEIEGEDSAPTVEQIEAVRDAAPEEIREDIDFVADRFVEAIESGEPDSVFSDEEVGRRLEEVIEPWEQENCPQTDEGEGEGDGEGEGAAGDIDPAYAEYCVAAAELDEQEDFPSNEQLQNLADVAPEEIAADVQTVVDAAVERGPDAFGDPAVSEPLDRVEAFEDENCGLGDEEATDDLGASQELEPDAQEVAVSAVEYDFEFEAPAAGRTSFVMTNEGEEPHFMFLVALAEGVTFEEAFEAEGEGGTVIGEAESDTATPGGEAILTVDLEPGDYGMLCFIPAPDGEAHAEKGMAVPFTVR